MTVDNNELPKDLRVLVDFLKIYGELIKSVGQIEKETGKSIDELYREALKPEIISEFTKKVPPELLSDLFITMFRIAALPLNRINQLSAEEKIEVGEQLIEYAKHLEEVLKQINEVTKKHGEEGD